MLSDNSVTALVMWKIFFDMELLTMLNSVVKPPTQVTKNKNKQTNKQKHCIYPMGQSSKYYWLHKIRVSFSFYLWHVDSTVLRFLLIRRESSPLSSNTHTHTHTQRERHTHIHTHLISLCSPDWSETWYVVETGFEFIVIYLLLLPKC
jgi:hypothetical protein